LGLYAPSAAGADEQLRLLTCAFELGATVDEVVGAFRIAGVGSLGPLMLDLVMRPAGETCDLDTFAETSGLDPVLVRRLWLALGLPDSAIVPLLVTPDAGGALRFMAGMTAVLGEDAVLAVARVVG